MDIKKLGDSMVYHEQTFTKRVLFADRNSLSFVLNLKTGQSLPKHKHERSTLVLCVLQGAGEVRVNEDAARLETGDFLSVKGEDEFEIPSVAQDMSMLVTLSPNPSNELYAKELG